MTQEKIIRRMIEGFIDDPPDTDYQRGFFACILMIANEVMGIEWNDPLTLEAENIADRGSVENIAVSAKVTPAFTVINGGKDIDG